MLQIYRKRYDVHNNVAYIMTLLKCFTPEMRLKRILKVIHCMIDKFEYSCSCIIQFIKLVKKGDKMFDKPRILSLFPNSINKFNKT